MVKSVIEEKLTEESQLFDDTEFCKGKKIDLRKKLDSVE
jgi:hypothetical protein